MKSLETDSVNDLFQKIIEIDCNASTGHLINRPDQLVIIADWNNPILNKLEIPDKISCRFDDELLRCDGCQLLLEMYTSSVFPEYFINDDGEVCCPACSKKEDHTAYIELLINNPKRSNLFITEEELKSQGFEELPKHYYSGLHPGQNDDPKDIVETLMKEFPNSEFIVNVVNSDMFTVEFSISSRCIPKDDNYKAMSKGEFDSILNDMLNEEKSLLSVPGIYEIVSEYYNNAILERWERTNLKTP